MSASRQSCGTACCIAKKTALLRGELTYAIDPGGTASMVFQPDGRVVHVEFIAQEALGLTDEEATALFDGDNELADVEEWVELIISGDFDEDDWLNRRDRHQQELEHG